MLTRTVSVVTVFVVSVVQAVVVVLPTESAVVVICCFSLCLVAALALTVVTCSFVTVH